MKLTYKVIAKQNPHAQKSISVNVQNNSNAFNQFEEKVRVKLGDKVRFNHPGKIIVILEDNFNSLIEQAIAEFLEKNN